jgi:hypothetical protein
MVQRSAGMDTTRKDDEEKTRQLDGQKASGMQWQREDWKNDSRWIKKSGDWESEYISDIKKLIHTYV